MNAMQTLYDAVASRPGVAALAGAWHERCLVSHAFSHPGQHPHHLDRLTAYWVEALGGPPDFTAEPPAGTGDDESHVVRLHSGNGEHDEMDRRAVACFVAALDDVGLSSDERLRTTLVEWFTWATAYLSTYHDSADDVPAGLPLPRWGWEGLQHA